MCTLGSSTIHSIYSKVYILIHVKCVWACNLDVFPPLLSSMMTVSFYVRMLQQSFFAKDRFYLWILLCLCFKLALPTNCRSFLEMFWFCFSYFVCFFCLFFSVGQVIVSLIDLIFYHCWSVEMTLPVAFYIYAVFSIYSLSSSISLFYDFFSF